MVKLTVQLGDGQAEWLLDLLLEGRMPTADEIMGDGIAMSVTGDTRDRCRLAMWMAAVREVCEVALAQAADSEEQVP